MARDYRKKYDRKKYDNKSKRDVLKVEDIVTQLAEETDEQKRSEVVLNYLVTMGRFHRYSLNNQLLIAIQKPEATLVAGFHKWKSLGRHVKKGEKGIQILMPIFLKDKKVDVKDRVKDAELEEEIQDIPEMSEQEAQEQPQKERTRVWFKPTYVFDISQTEGKPLPEIRTAIPGNYQELIDKLIAACREKGIDVKFRKLGFGHYGTSFGGEIEIAEGLSPGETFSTLVHEVLHELLHKDRERADRSAEAKRRREIQAEGVAYVVCTTLGIPNHYNAARYLVLNGATTKEIMENLQAISTGSKMILEMVGHPTNLLELYAEAQKQDAELAAPQAATRIQEVFESAQHDVQYSEQEEIDMHESTIVQGDMFGNDPSVGSRKPFMYH